MNQDNLVDRIFNLIASWDYINSDTFEQSRKLANFIIENMKDNLLFGKDMMLKTELDILETPKADGGLRPLDTVVIPKIAEVTRLVVVDHRGEEPIGRIIDTMPVKIETSLQDENRTLKIFITKR